MFCRWLAAYRERDAATRKSIESIARSVAEGQCRGIDREWNLNTLDTLLFGETP